MQVAQFGKEEESYHYHVAAASTYSGVVIQVVPYTGGEVCHGAAGALRQYGSNQ